MRRFYIKYLLYSAVQRYISMWFSMYIRQYDLLLLILRFNIKIPQHLCNIKKILWNFAEKKNFYQNFTASKRWIWLKPIKYDCCYVKNTIYGTKILWSILKSAASSWLNAENKLKVLKMHKMQIQIWNIPNLRIESIKYKILTHDVVNFV